jgi:hypothetical protein
MKISIESDDTNADALLFEMATWLRARGFDVELPSMPVATKDTPDMVVKQADGPARSIGPHLPTMSNALRDGLKESGVTVSFKRVTVTK